MFTFDRADILNPPNGPMLGGLGAPIRNYQTVDELAYQLMQATPAEKAEYYNAMIAAGVSDEDLRNVVENAVGTQSDSDWKALQILAAKLDTVAIDYSPYLDRLTPAQRLLADKMLKMQGQGTPAEVIEYVSNLNDLQAASGAALSDGVYNQIEDRFNAFKQMENLSQYYGIPVVSYGATKLNQISASEIQAEENKALLTAARPELERAAAEQAAAEAAQRAVAEAQAAADRAAAAEAARARAEFMAEADRLNKLAAEELAKKAAAAAAADAAAKAAAADAAAKAAAADAAAKAASAEAAKTQKPVDYSSMTIDEKVRSYLELRNKGMTDAQVRAFVEASVGPQSDADWKALRDLALSVVTTETPVTPPPPTGAANVAPLLLAVAAAYLLGA